MTDRINTSPEAVERLAQTFEAEAQHFNRQANIDAANMIAATLRALLAERDELRGLLVTHEICADKMKADAARMREALREIVDAYEINVVGHAEINIARAALGGTGHDA